MKPTKAVRKRYRENNPEQIKENNNRTNKYAFAYKGKTVYVGHNPRKGICTKCGKQKKTVLHHEKYDDENPLAHTVEMCYQCHKKTHDQINKKNQEDAEKWNKLEDLLKLCKITMEEHLDEARSNQRIVERLKKLYEENKWMLTSERTNDDGSIGKWDEMGILSDIQKILGEKNDS